MFERFTERSRRVVVLAQEEARMLNHGYIGTEHILLGLLHEQEGAAARALTGLGVSLDEARDQVLSVIGRGEQEPHGHIPFTPRAKRVLELALREALELKQHYIGTEHILLGLVHEGNGVGAQVLVKLGASLTAVRRKATELAGTDPPVAEGGQPTAFAAPSATGRWSPLTGRAGVQVLNELRGVLESIDRRLAAIERHLGLAAEGGEDSEDGGEPPGDTDVAVK